MTAKRGKDFADLVYGIVIQGKRYRASDVAAAMGLGYHAFNARCTGKTPFSADEIRRLLSAAPDPRLVAYLLRGTPYVPAERIDPERVEDHEAIHWAATRIIIEAADVLEAVEKGLADKRIDHRDALGIRRDIETAEQALASLRERIRMLLEESGAADSP